MALLSVQNLSVDLKLANGTLHAVRDVSFDLDKGETMGIVGESGSGKSLTAMALMRLLPKTATITATSLMFDGVELKDLAQDRLLSEVCGIKISMIFQEPMTSLNPVYSIERQMTEGVLLRKRCSKAEARDRAINLLEKVGIANAASRLNQYPHQLSGGQRQRVMIAMALMAKPKLIIADEPTTALDVTVQAQILKLLVQLGKDLGMSMILITHDLGVISRMVDKVGVMYGGQLVETGTTEQVFRTPLHPYTSGLLQCIPSLDEADNKDRLGTIPGIVPSLMGKQEACSFANRCEFSVDKCVSTNPPEVAFDNGRSHRCLRSDEIASHLGVFDGPQMGSDVVHISQGPVVLEVEHVSRTFHVKKTLLDKNKPLTAVNDVSLKLYQSEVLALVGESGCGKTTLAKMMLGLDTVDSGRIAINGIPVDDIDIKERALLIQPIFQDPYSSLNPRRTIGETIRQPLQFHNIGSEKEQRRKVEETMELVGLPPRFYHVYPNQLSGGQRQRVAISRALVLQPQIILCDEPTSALDVSVQAQILNLLRDLREELGLTFFIITHDLGVVNHMATRIAVMYLGQLVETGTRHQIIHESKHPYTQALMQSVLSLEPGGGIPTIDLGGGFPNPLDLPSGCLFHPRCPKAMNKCRHEKPDLLKKDGREARCYLYQ
jgi:peptide/nickel transport system ATP-binding protein